MKKYIEKQKAIEDVVDEIRRKVLGGDDRSFSRVTAHLQSVNGDISLLSEKKVRSGYYSASPKDNPFLRNKAASPMGAGSTFDRTPHTTIPEYHKSIPCINIVATLKCKQALVTEKEEQFKTPDSSQLISVILMTWQRNLC